MAIVTIDTDLRTVVIQGDGKPGDALSVLGAFLDDYVDYLHARIPDPAPGATLPGGALIPLEWHLKVVHPEITTDDLRWPQGPNGPTPGTHVWTTVDGVGTWEPPASP